MFAFALLTADYKQRTAGAHASAVPELFFIYFTNVKITKFLT